MQSCRFALTLALVTCLALPALAEEILLNDGAEVDGEIQSVDENGIVVKVGDTELTIEPLRLDPHYYYEQWKKRLPKDDAKAHLRLAVYAFEHGMFNQARSLYRKAERIDKAVVQQFELEVVPQIKEGVAEQLLDLAKKAVDKQDYDQAERIVAKILTQLEDTKAAEEARTLLGSVHLWQLNKDEERLVKRLARHLPREEEERLKAQERITKKIGPIERKIRKARDRVALGLRTKSNNRQKDIFISAARSYESAIKSLNKLEAEAGDDEALKAHIDEVKQVATREAIEAYIHAGNVYLIRRDYQNSIDVANRALALDPNSAHAKRFLQETIRGSQQRSGWWGRGR